MKDKTGKAKPSVGKNVEDSKAGVLNAILVARKLAKGCGLLL